MSGCQPGGLGRRQNQDVVNAPYFHVVFTIPSELHTLIYQNQEQLYALMYRAVAKTLLELSEDPKYLGAQLGFFSLLHTWGQNLHYHPHIHTAVLAGGLTRLSQWRHSSKKFFIPVKVLAKNSGGNTYIISKIIIVKGYSISMGKQPHTRIQNSLRNCSISVMKSHGTSIPKGHFQVPKRLSSIWADTPTELPLPTPAL
jgi:hypothetical protein